MTIGKEQHRRQTDETDMIPMKGTVKLPYAKIGGFAISLMACVAMFQFFVPSKAAVEQMQSEIVTLKQNQAADHDAVTKLSSDVEYIRHWVEEQERKRNP